MSFDLIKPRSRASLGLTLVIHRRIVSKGFRHQVVECDSDSHFKVVWQAHLNGIDCWRCDSNYVQDSLDSKQTCGRCNVPGSANQAPSPVFRVLLIHWSSIFLSSLVTAADCMILCQLSRICFSIGPANMLSGSCRKPLYLRQLAR